MKNPKILFDSNGEPLFENSFERINLSDEEKDEIQAAYKTLDKFNIDYSSQSDDSVLADYSVKTDRLGKVDRIAGVGSLLGVIWALGALYSLFWEKNTSPAALFLGLCIVDFGVILKTIIMKSS